MKLEDSYSTVYENENFGNIDLIIPSWPKDRYQASIFWAGSGINVLDIGCGNGTVLYNLRTKFDKLYGVELSKSRVLTAKKTLRGHDAKIYFSNIETGTEFKDNFFDVVIISDVIEHTIDIFAVMAEIYRILKVGGKLILNTPNVASITKRFVLLFGKFPSTSAGNEGLNVRMKGELFDGGHLHYFTFSLLRKLLQKYGYSQIEQYGFGKLGRIHNIYPSLFSNSCQIVAIK